MADADQVRQAARAALEQLQGRASAAELQAAKLQAAASAKVVRAADESLGTLLDVMA